MFVWVNALHEHVAGDAPPDERTTSARRRPPPHFTSDSSASERLDFTAAYTFEGFEALSAHAVSLAESVTDPYDGLLRMLASCYPAEAGPLHRAQHVGASYKQLAYIAHLSGMTPAQRREWYRIAERIPLSQRHAGHLISELQARAA